MRDDSDELLIEVLNEFKHTLIKIKDYSELGLDSSISWEIESSEDYIEMIHERMKDKLLKENE